MSNAQCFELIFLLFLFGDLFLKLYLDARQARSIRLHRDSVPKDFASAISLQAHQKAADYCLERIRFSRIEHVVDLVWLLILTLGGLISFIYRFYYQANGNDLLSQIFIVLTVAFLSALINLPFQWYSAFHIEAKYGFNTMTPARFFKDLLLSAVLGLVIGVPLFAIIFWLWEAAGALWWIWAWLAYVVFNFALLWIYPSFIAPLFNKFTRLPDGEVADRVNALLTRVGFATNGLYVMDASKRSSKANAYMTGFGKTKRIVFFDTLLAKLSPIETEAVLAHELGHYKLRHIIKMMLFSFSLSFVVFFVLDWASGSSWFYEGLGVQLYLGSSPAVALILFFEVLSVFTFPFSPMTSILSRKYEFQADRFAVQNSDGKALASALVKLFKDNASTLTPDKLYSAFYSSHPDAAIRVDAINQEIANASKS